jgi:hypothetical protein
VRLSRPRRQRDSITATHGEGIHHHIEADLHWLVDYRLVDGRG